MKKKKKRKCVAWSKASLWCDGCKRMGGDARTEINTVICGTQSTEMKNIIHTEMKKNLKGKNDAIREGR